MEQNYLVRAAKYLADLRKRKAWRKVVSGLGTLVVFCTVYALILPAITWSRTATCEKEEHHHTDECYALVEAPPASETAPITARLPGQPQCSVEAIYAAAMQNQERVEEHAPFVLHTHTAECFLGEGGALICPLFSHNPHVHDDTCYEERKVLICGLAGVTPGETAPDGTPSVPPTTPSAPSETPGTTETPGTEQEIPLHKHSDTCYGQPTLICKLVEGPGSEGHHHTDACYTVTTVPGELVCASTEEGHVHGDACYAPATETRTLTCPLPESEPVPAHQHVATCWELQLTCGQIEGEPERLVTIPDEQIPISGETAEAEGGSADPGEQTGTPAAGEQTGTPVHVHSDACYRTERVLICGKDEDTEHLHVPTCYDENGQLICGRLVTVSHVHTAECFPQETPDANQPEQPQQPDQPGQVDPSGRTLICGKEEHTHTEECFPPSEPGEPGAPGDPSAPDNGQQKEAWDAIFWSHYVEEASDVVLDARTNGVWSDTAAMEPERLAQLYSAPEEDVTRYLSQNIGIQIDQQLYNEGHGPMDAGAQFSVLLSWSMNEASFSTMTYTYQFPQQVLVENVERRVLNDEAGDTALAYSVENNQLRVTYYRPAADVETTFLLKASWAPDLGEQTRVQWSPSTFTDVTFAKPELTITKTMGENGLRVEESGEVWADYTVTVSNNSLVAAKAVTLKDNLESQYFHFARGAFDNSADYSLTVNTAAAVPSAEGETPEAPVTPGAEQFLTFENYDGGNVLTFPEFDLAPGESRVFQYKARMSSEDRELVDQAIEAAKDAQTPADPFATPLSAGETAAKGSETVRNTATVTCPACGEGVEFSASSQGTYNGLESKHIEDYTQTYKGETFDVTFTVNGDALLPPGISADRVEELGRGNFLLQITKKDETTEEYQAFAEKINAKTEGEEESSDSSEQLELAVLGLELRYNSMKLDLSDCEVMATVTPNEKLLNYKPAKTQPITVGEDGETVAEDELGYGVELAAFTLEEQTDVMTGTTEKEAVEEGSIYIDVTADSETKTTSATASAPVIVSYNSSYEDGVDPLSVSAFAARTMSAEAPMSETATAGGESSSVVASPVRTNDGSIKLAVKNACMAANSCSVTEPACTIEFYGYVNLLDVKHGVDATNNRTAVTIIDTSKATGLGKLPANGDIKRDATQNNEIKQKLAYLELSNVTSGTVNTKPALKQLFDGISKGFGAYVESFPLDKFAILEQMGEGKTNYDVFKVEIWNSSKTELKQEIYLLNSTDKNSYEAALNAAESATKEEDKIAKVKEAVEVLNNATLKSPSEILFTRDQTASQTEGPYFIAENDVVKLICRPSQGTFKADVKFYDYDISDGLIYKVPDGYKVGADKGPKLERANGQKVSNQDDTLWAAYVEKQGINSDSNYSGTDKHLGFGNSNTATGLGNVENGSYKINMAATQNFRNCSFGIPSELDSNGHIVYASGIVAPKLFDDGYAKGKTVYNNFQLEFNRVGDTYTMTKVLKDGQARAYGQNLDQLAYTGKAGLNWSTGAESNDTFSMYSNSFWPMDDANGNGTDIPSHGTDGHDLKFGDNSKKNLRVAFGSEDKPTGTTFPVVDNNANVDHNAYFGMQFRMEFTIPEDYMGPLEYCFFGDDDLWLFLDGKLVCDIGGTHQAAGEYVDLRDYLPIEGESQTGKPTVGAHRLDLYYTERGASGSTCWMQFTVPGLRVLPIDAPPTKEVGNLRIEKKVEGIVDQSAQYSFDLSLLALKNSAANSKVPYTIYKSDGTKQTGTTAVTTPATKLTFNLTAGEYILLEDLPDGTKYTVQETSTSPSYQTTISTTEDTEVTQGKTIEGTISVSTDQGGVIHVITYTNAYHFELPETGGPGTIWYTYGALPALMAAVVLYKRSRKKGGTVS